MYKLTNPSELDKNFKLPVITLDSFSIERLNDAMTRLGDDAIQQKAERMGMISKKIKLSDDLVLKIRRLI